MTRPLLCYEIMGARRLIRCLAPLSLHRGTMTMANDLTTPLTGRKRKPGAQRHLPIARTLFAVLALIGVAFVLRLVLVDDPDGGRPSEEVAITTTRNSNEVANAVSDRSGDHHRRPAAIPGRQLDHRGAIGHDRRQLHHRPARHVRRPARSQRGDRRRADSAHLGDRPDAVRHLCAPGRSKRWPAASPMIAIVVTGLGINEQGSLDAIDQLPDEVTLAFAPYGKTLTTTVAAARTAGHEVLLEVPLEPFDYPQNDPGPQTLLTGEPPRANLDKLFWLMARFGGYVGRHQQYGRPLHRLGRRFLAHHGRAGRAWPGLSRRWLVQPLAGATAGQRQQGAVFAGRPGHRRQSVAPIHSRSACQP